MWHSVDNHPGVPLIFFSIPLPLGPDTLAALATTRNLRSREGVMGYREGKKRNKMGSGGRQNIRET